MSISKAIKRLRKLSERDTLPLHARVIHLSEECGEVCKAWRYEQGLRGDKLDEPMNSECIDVINCAIDVFTKNGGTYKELIKILEVKTDKWERNILAMEFENESPT